MNERPSDSELALVLAGMRACVESGRDLIRWLRHRVWMLRAVTFVNVGCAAFNASNVGGHAGGIAALGVVLNSWGAWRALRVEADFQGDIRETSVRVGALVQKIEEVERVRNES